MGVFCTPLSRCCFGLPAAAAAAVDDDSAVLIAVGSRFSGNFVRLESIAVVKRC